MLKEDPVPFFFFYYNFTLLLLQILSKSPM